MHETTVVSGGSKAVVFTLAVIAEDLGISERMVRYWHRQGNLALDVGPAPTTCGSAYFSQASSLEAFGQWHQCERQEAISVVRAAAGRHGAEVRWRQRQPFVLVKPRP
jgi:hypothetical protein